MQVRSAFTLLEIILVIVVIGILATLAMQSFSSNALTQATEQVASHIRYAQHLAMVDNAYTQNSTVTWQNNRWQIHFEDSNIGNQHKIYLLYRNKDGQTNEDDDELARDPLTGKLMSGKLLDNPKYMNIMDLTETYGIKNIIFSSSCHYSSASATSNRLVFDNYGRPYYYANSTHRNPLEFRLKSNCVITLVGKEGNSTITVRPTTGYVTTQYSN